MLVQASLVTALAASAAIIAIGARFLLYPQRATTDFGVVAGNVRALTAIKGVRDISSGIVLLVVWWTAGSRILGFAMLAASFTPAADAVIVLTNGGTTTAALTIHGATAATLVIVGLILAQVQE